MPEDERDFGEIRRQGEIDEARMQARKLLAALMSSPDLRSPAEPADPEGLTEVDRQMGDMILAPDGAGSYTERVFEIKGQPMIIVKQFRDLESGGQETYWQAVPASERERG